MIPIVQYLTNDELPSDEGMTNKIKRMAAKYTIEIGKLYKMGKTSPMQRCLGKNETSMVLMEVHEGVCGTHTRGRVLAHKLMKVDYNWPTMMKYVVKLVNKCENFPRHSNLYHAQTEVFYSVSSP